MLVSDRRATSRKQGVWAESHQGVEFAVARSSPPFDCQGHEPARLNRECLLRADNGPPWDGQKAKGCRITRYLVEEGA